MEARFNKIYENQGFFDRYNGSVFGTAFVVIIFFIIFSYFYIQTRMDPIRANWTQERCSPAVIPFAGLVNAPPDKSKFQFTYDNFNYCVKSIIKGSATAATEPITAVIRILADTIKGLGDAIDAVRKIVDGIRTTVEEVSRNIMSRILNMLIPIQRMLLLFKATMGKAHATLVTGMYTAIGGLWFLISGLLSVYKLIIIILIALAAMIAGFWAIPFGFGIPAAIAFTTVFIAIAIPMGLIEGAISEVIKITGINQSVSSVPGLCFKKGTLVRGTNNVLYSIESIPLGTRIVKGGEVTAVLKLDASNQTMYKLGNVTVSGMHKVRYEKQWIYVSEHPDAIKIENFEDKYIYCLNTSKKVIAIGDYIFQDWDEMDEELLKKCGCETTEQVFNNLENGFHPGTVLQVKSKGKIKIKDIDIGDVLKTEERIIGIVKIKNNKDLVNYDNEGFIGTKQFYFLQNLGIISPTLERSDILYHILTDKGHLHIKEQKLMDYNWNIDFFNV